MKKNRKITILVFVSATLLRLIYFYLTPLYQAPDEIFHFERIIIEANKIVNFANFNNFSPFYQNTEFFHPPLYYWLMGFFVSLTIKIFKASENFLQSLSVMMIFLRFFNLSISIASLFVGKIFLDQFALSEIAYFNALLLMFFIPTLVGSSFVITNDSLFLLLTNLTVYCLAVSLKRGEKMGSFLKLGLILGMAILTKMFALSFLFSIFYIILKDKRKFLGKYLIVFLLPNFLISGWWFIKNWFSYKNIFAFPLLMVSLSGSLLPFSFKNYPIIVFSWIFETFLATFGMTNNIRLKTPFYWITAVFFLFGFWGFLKTKKNKFVLTLVKALSFSFLINFLQLIGLNFSYAFQPQGRYLFAQLPFISLVIGSGLSSILGRMRIFGLFFTILLLILLHLASLSCLSFFYKGDIILSPLFFCRFY